MRHLPTPGLVVAAAFASVLAAGGPARAQSLENETDGPSIALGETRLFPSVRVDALRNDNAFLTADDEIDANVFLVSPRVLWVADRRLLTLRATYDGEFSQSSESVLEHADHRLGLTVSAEPATRLRVDGNLSYLRGHQEPGANLTRGLGTGFDEPVTFDQFQLGGSTRYGADGARGNLTVGLGIIGRNYTTLPIVTDGRDFLSIVPFAQFSLRIAGDTRALVELRFADIDFDEDALDRSDVSLLGGVSFAPTGRTSGELKIGAASSDFSTDERDDQTTFIVEGTVDFAPREYSRLRLVLSRQLDNAASVQVNTADGEAVSDEARLDWIYDWSERVSQAVFLRYEAVTRGCPILGDQTTSAGIEVSLQVRRWLELGLSGEAGQRNGVDCDGVDEATVDAIDYDVTQIGGFVRARL